MYGWSFNPTFQVYVARGYGVLYLNPRGSSGYGQKFSDGTINEWGGGDYRDLMMGVDEALKKNSWIDPDHLGVTGGSYGGFMTNWIITQTTRFRGAVAVASLSNLISFYSTSLYQDLIHAEFGGFPWDNFELLWQWSPLRFVRNAQTPTLFIHGENDNDVHITQAEEMYMALKRRGIDTVLVRYPREGHGLREPNIVWTRWNARWPGSIATSSRARRKKAQRVQLAGLVCVLWPCGSCSRLRLPLLFQVTHDQRIAEDPDDAGLITRGYIARFEGVMLADYFAADLVSNRREVDKPRVVFDRVTAAGSMEHPETGWFVFFLVARLSEVSDFHDLGVDFLH
jgi:dienelactone hydrolase